MANKKIVMPAGIKARWIRALRSGKYAQTTRQLKEPYRPAYCCLGVLCKVAQKPMEYSVFEDKWMTTKQSTIFQDMNDERNYSFNRIANYIERYL